MAIVKTHIRIPSQETQHWVPGDYTAENLKSMYAAQFPGLQSMVAAEEIVSTPTGQERIVTFTPRTGNKG
jgi:hypothetical protein